MRPIFFAGQALAPLTVVAALRSGGGDAPGRKGSQESTSPGTKPARPAGVNGAGDGRHPGNADLDADKAFAGRSFAQPLKRSTLPAFQGVVVAAGAPWRLSAPWVLTGEAAAAWSVGLNGWLNRNARILARFFHPSFEGGGGFNPLGSATFVPPATVTAQDENVLFTRLQLSF